VASHRPAALCATHLSAQGRTAGPTCTLPSRRTGFVVTTSVVLTRCRIRLKPLQQAFGSRPEGHQPDDALAILVAVADGGIDVVDAGLEGPVQHANGEFEVHACFVALAWAPISVNRAVASAGVARMARGAE